MSESFRALLKIRADFAALPTDQISTRLESFISEKRTEFRQQLTESFWAGRTAVWKAVMSNSIKSDCPLSLHQVEDFLISEGCETVVTAFLDFKTFKKFSDSLAWETEVWIADMPDHMIHLNGDKFLGPRE